MGDWGGEAGAVNDTGGGNNLDLGDKRLPSPDLLPIQKQKKENLSNSAYLPSLLESIMETCNVVLTVVSAVKTLWCDYLNEISLAVLLHGTIFIQYFIK